MKNLLDHLDTALAASKSSALVVASGSPRGRMATLSGVRHVLRALHVRAIIGQIAVCPQDRDPQSGQWLESLLIQAYLLVAVPLRQLVPPAGVLGAAALLRGRFKKTARHV
ncbi:NAD(P)H-dependent FMN reductase [Robbsia andropogonis]